jgi:hypothetical protein
MHQELVKKGLVCYFKGKKNMPVQFPFLFIYGLFFSKEKSLFLTKMKQNDFFFFLF